MSLYIASSPHAHRGKNTGALMRDVILCLIPGIIAQTVYFGWGNLIHVIWGAFICVLLEAGVLYLRKRPVLFTIKDGSAALSGVLLGIALPPLSPWWLMLIGCIFAILIAKHLYGGLGQNIFNPAMVAYVVLIISFPVQMTSWMPVAELQAAPQSFLDTLQLTFTGFNTDGFDLNQARSTLSHAALTATHDGYSGATALDGFSGATPLDAIKSSIKSGIDKHTLFSAPIFTPFAGAGWQWVNFAFLLGGMILLLRRSIMWYIPAGMLLSLFICATIGNLFAPELTCGPIIHLFSGATMVGAFFIATDPVSASTTPKGRLIYASLIGILVYLIRTLGNFPDAVAFSVLLANICVPLIDYYTIPRPYGRS